MRLNYIRVEIVYIEGWNYNCEGETTFMGQLSIIDDTHIILIINISSPINQKFARVVLSMQA